MKRQFVGCLMALAALLEARHVEHAAVTAVPWVRLASDLLVSAWEIFRVLMVALKVVSPCSACYDGRGSNEETDVDPCLLLSCMCISRELACDWAHVAGDWAKDSRHFAFLSRNFALPFFLF